MKRDNKPYIEEKIDENVYMRTFKESIDDSELVWHKDKEDRIIEPLYETDWGFQKDNELPLKLDKVVEIKKLQYHRLIKGKGDLVLKITKNK